MRRAELADVLALVGAGVADDDHGGVGGAGEGGGRVGVGAVLGDHVDFWQRRPQSGQMGDHVRGVDVAAAAVPEVARIGEGADHREASEPARVEGEDRAAVDGLVAEQHDRLGGGLAGEGAVGRGCDDVRCDGRSIAVAVGGVAEHRRHRAGHARPDGGVGNGALGDGLVEAGAPDHAGRHLDVEARGDRRAGVAQAEDPVADDEALEAPLVAEHVGEERGALAAPLAVDRVVRAHHARHPFVDDAPEVGQVHLVQRAVVDGDVDSEAGVLHRVGGEVLDRRHHVALHPSGQRRAHLAEVVGVLAVGLLRPSPRRVAQGVHADPAVQVGAHGPQLAPDGIADALLEVEVPRGAAGHGDGEGGGVADHHTARPVAEGEPGDAEAVDARGEERAAVVATVAEIGHPRPEGDVTVEAPPPLVVGHGVDERRRLVLRRRPRLHRVDGGVPFGHRQSMADRGHTGACPPMLRSRNAMSAATSASTSARAESRSCCRSHRPHRRQCGTSGWWSRSTVSRSTGSSRRWPATTELGPTWCAPSPGR